MLKVRRGFLGISSQCIVCAYQNNVFFTPLLLTLAAQKKKTLYVYFYFSYCNK